MKLMDRSVTLVVVAVGFCCLALFFLIFCIVLRLAKSKKGDHKDEGMQHGDEVVEEHMNNVVSSVYVLEVTVTHTSHVYISRGSTY